MAAYWLSSMVLPPHRDRAGIKGPDAWNVGPALERLDDLPDGRLVGHHVFPWKELQHALALLVGEVFPLLPGRTALVAVLPVLTGRHAGHVHRGRRQADDRRRREDRLLDDLLGHL